MSIIMEYYSGILYQKLYETLITANNKVNVSFCRFSYPLSFLLNPQVSIHGSSWEGHDYVRLCTRVRHIEYIISSILILIRK